MICSPAQYQRILENVANGVFREVKRTVVLGGVKFVNVDISIAHGFNEEKLYSNDDTRLILPRGLSFISVFTSDNSEKYIAIIRGHPKFGYDGDCRTPMADTGVTWVYSRKENGECGHVSGFIYNGIRYLVIGSKNVHMILREDSIDEDLQNAVYQDQRYTFAVKIAKILVAKYASSIAKIVSFSIEKDVTLCCEAITDCQHIVDYYGEHKLLFFAITSIRESVDSPITWCNPILAQEHFLELGLDSVTEIKIASTPEELQELYNYIRSQENSEGGVINVLDADGNVVYVYKYKNDMYVLLRAGREQMRKRAPINVIDRRLRSLHHINLPNMEELIMLVLQFNCYFRLLGEEDQSSFFSKWNDWMNRFLELPSEERASLLEQYRRFQSQNGSLFVIVLVGVQGSGKSTIARLLKELLSILHGLTSKEVMHLEQDMFGGSRPNFQAAVKKALSNPGLRFLILATMNHTSEHRRRLDDELLATYKGNLQKVYIVFDPNTIEFYLGRLKSRGSAHETLVANGSNDATILQILSRTLREYSPPSEEEEYTPTVHVSCEATIQSIIQTVLEFLAQQFVVDPLELTTDAFEHAMACVIADDERLSRKPKKAVKEQKPRNPQFDGIRVAPESIPSLEDILSRLQADESALSALTDNFNAHCIKTEFHITTAYYGGKKDGNQDFEDGKECRIRVNAIASDSKATALSCEVDDVTIESGIPHITYALGTDETTGKAVPPSYSKQLIETSIENGCLLKLREPIELTGVIFRKF
jgi:energy-coupling factor transporter ATP-binding protein EcfA2